MGNEGSRIGQKLNYGAVPAKDSADLTEHKDGILDLSLVEARGLAFLPCIYKSLALGCSLKGV